MVKFEDRILLTRQMAVRKFDHWILKVTGLKMRPVEVLSSLATKN